MPVAKVVVQLDLFGAMHFGAAERGAVVGRGQRGRSEVRQGEEQALRLQGLRTLKGGRDRISSERVHPCERIAQRREGRKVSLAHRGGGHVGREQVGGHAFHSIEIEKEKCLVLLDRSAERPPVIVQVLKRLHSRKRVARVGGAVAQVPEHAAVKLVGAGFGRGGDGPHAAKLGARGQHAGGELLDGFHRGLRHVIRAAEIAERGLDAIHFHFDAGRARARRQPLGAVADLHHARHGQRQNAGDQPGIARVLRYGTQVGGGLDDQARREAGADGRRFQLHHGRCRIGDHDFGGGRRHLESQVLPHGAEGLDREGAGFDCTETLGIRHQPVVARGKVGKCVHTAGVGLRRAAHAGIIIGERNGGCGNGTSRSIDRKTCHGSERRLAVECKHAEKERK